MDIAGLITEYETGTLNIRSTLNLFAELIRTGLAWSLQGNYGRTAKALIEHGLVSDDGVINENRVTELIDEE